MDKEFIKEDSKMDAAMDSENFNGKMVKFSKDNGWSAAKMDGDNGTPLKEIVMKENGRIIGNREEEPSVIEEDPDT